MERITVKHMIPTDFLSDEAIKTLRTNLMFSGEDIRVVAMTSFSSAEGKSTISFRTAASLAQAGKRVILLDADLRKSVLYSRLRGRGKIKGLSHCLSGMANVNETIMDTDIPGLYIMFAGTRVPNSTELLGSRNFENLVAALRKTFDYVIIDTAPLGLVIDCAVISPVIDGVLMVIDVVKNSYKLERRVKAQLEKSGAKILGVVLNRVDTRDRHGYYSKNYTYKYSGYGNNR